MKIESDQKWSEQVSVLRETLGEEQADEFVGVVELLARGAEDLLEADLGEKEPTGTEVVLAVRETFRQFAEENGMPIPRMAATLLVMLILHWEFGQLLSESLTPIEESLVLGVAAEYVDEKQQGAAEGE